MHLASDYIHHHRSAGGRRVRIYLPKDARDMPVVSRPVCSSLGITVVH